MRIISRCNIPDPKAPTRRIVGYRVEREDGDSADLVGAANLLPDTPEMEAILNGQKAARQALPAQDDEVRLS